MVSGMSTESKSPRVGDIAKFKVAYVCVCVYIYIPGISGRKELSVSLSFRELRALYDCCKTSIDGFCFPFPPSLN